MDIQSMLCKTCSSLDLTFASFVIGFQRTTDSSTAGTKNNHIRPGVNQGKKRLGTMRDILLRSVGCSLCRLIAKSVAEQKNTLLARALGGAGSNVPAGEATVRHRNLDVACEISWQIDGREKTADEFGTVFEVPRTRRLCIQWPNSQYLEAHLLLMAPNNQHGPRSLFLGRQLPTSDEPRIDQIRRWYSLCSQEHGKSCAIDHASEEFEDLRTESYFGVIDLEAKQLTSLPEHSDYAALSYTWGRHQDHVARFYITLDNVEDRHKPGGLRAVEDKLPKTIQDTFALVRNLGIRYLWVDSLCILQGDEEHWALNASKMDIVYGHSSLTICAADGKDANRGLDALHPTPDTQTAHYSKQNVEMIRRDMNLMVAYPSEVYIENSTWNTRAWTFQERVFSRRCLIFTEGRIYFQCRSSTMSENIYAEDPKAGWSIELLHGPLQRFRNLDLTPIDVYKYSVELYTSRRLTRDGDILAAFSGIGKQICSRLGGETLFGLPTSHFDFALLWKPDSPPHRRLSDGKCKFPSWSWCGWSDSRMTYDPIMIAGSELNLYEWLMYHTWITWYIRDGQGNLRLVWDRTVGSKRNSRVLRKWQGYCADETTAPNELNIEDPPAFDRYQRPIPEARRKLKRDDFDRTMPKYPYQVRVVEPGTPRAGLQFSDHRFLQFWTWSAHFYIFEEDPEERFSWGSKPLRSTMRLLRFGVQDGDYNLVGVILLDPTWAEHRHLDEPCEFIAISEAKSFAQEEIANWTFFEPSLPNQTEWYLYNVLLLQYDDEIKGVARRAGLGKIYKRAFDTACLMPGKERKKEWKEIILG